MYRIYIERVNSDPDFVYIRQTYTEARQLANSQQKEYVDAVEILDLETNNVKYRKRVNEDRSCWTIEVSDR